MSTTENTEGAEKRSKYPELENTIQPLEMRKAMQLFLLEKHADVTVWVEMRAHRRWEYGPDIHVVRCQPRDMDGMRYYVFYETTAEKTMLPEYKLNCFPIDHFPEVHPGTHEKQQEEIEMLVKSSVYYYRKHKTRGDHPRLLPTVILDIPVTERDLPTGKGFEMDGEYLLMIPVEQPYIYPLLTNNQENALKEFIEKNK